jgi:hypothetical protein
MTEGASDILMYPSLISKTRPERGRAIKGRRLRKVSRHHKRWNSRWTMALIQPDGLLQVPLECIKSVTRLDGPQKRERSMEASMPTSPNFDHDRPKTPIMNHE